MPQPPQALRLVTVGVSQPFAIFPSQLAKPALHALTTHVLLVHTEAAFASTQARPQAPQLFRSDASGVSQPLTALPSQLPNPGLHVSEHIAALHVEVPFMPAHTKPHMPQLFRSDATCVSQPMAGFASQLANPGLQAPSVHTPPAQVAVP
jgi:hypothetical protein